jgi:hypothetical protein
LRQKGLPVDLSWMAGDPLRNFWNAWSETP